MACATEVSVAAPLDFFCKPHQPLTWIGLHRAVHKLLEPDCPPALLHCNSAADCVRRCPVQELDAKVDALREQLSQVASQCGSLQRSAAESTNDNNDMVGDCV